MQRKVTYFRGVFWLELLFFTILLLSCHRETPRLIGSEELFIEFLKGNNPGQSQGTLTSDSCTCKALNCMYTTQASQLCFCKTDSVFSALSEAHASIYQLDYKQAFTLLSSPSILHSVRQHEPVPVLIYSRLLAVCLDQRSVGIPEEFGKEAVRLLAETSWPDDRYSNYAQALRLYLESLEIFSHNAYTEALIPAFAGLELLTTNTEHQFPGLQADFLYLIGKIYTHDTYYVLADIYFQKISSIQFPTQVSDYTSVLLTRKYLAQLMHADSSRQKQAPQELMPIQHYRYHLFDGLSQADPGKMRSSMSEALNAFQVMDTCNGMRRILLNYIADIFLFENKPDSAQYYNMLGLKPSCPEPSLHKEQRWHLYKTRSDIAFKICETYPNIVDCRKASELFHEQQQFIDSSFSITDPHVSDAAVLNAAAYLFHLLNISELFNQDSVHWEALRIIQQSKSRTLIRGLKDRYHDELLESNPDYRQAHLELSALLQKVDNFKTVMKPDPRLYQDIYKNFKIKQTYLSNAPKLEIPDEEIPQPLNLLAWLKSNDTQLFQFLGTDSSYFVVYFNADTSGFYKIPRLTVDSCVDVWRNSLYHQDVPLQKHLQFMQDLLLQGHLNADIQNVIFLPDLNLSQFPFEILMTDENDSRYIIEDHVISYHYDVDQLISDEKNTEEIHSIAALSWSDPQTIAAGNAEYAELPGGYSECKALCEQLEVPCAFESGQRLTKDKFERALNSDILHLSTHAFSSDVNRLDNYLLLRKGKEPYRYFAYNLPKNALKHVVLSACETGTGTYLPGEGVYSISREFIRGGCEVVTKSLWKISDRQTSTLLQEYYRELKKGTTPPQALRAAKLNYLAKRNKLSHPWYWAGLITEGNPLISFSF